jgi:hypothetical protein
MKKRRLLVSAEEARPSKKQHVRPCGDCPWRRDALKGWTGASTTKEWLTYAHGEDIVYCHTMSGPRDGSTMGPQCAGLAIYRANVCKIPRNRAQQLILPADRGAVFASPAEFKQYHDE